MKPLNCSLNKLSCLLLMALLFTSAAALNSKRRTLFNSLDPFSVSHHLAFYELYKGTPEGSEALKRAWTLLSGTENPQENRLASIHSYTSIINGVISLVNKQSKDTIPELSEEQLQFIDKLASHLPNRHLKGRWVTSEADILKLPFEEIDLARGLLLSDGEIGNLPLKIRSYEAMMDLMALQVLTRVKMSDPPEKKIHAMNDFIFHELGFRFPPHSLYAKEIDHYTFLPSVLDTRKGVCLGVSILYLCLSQRIALPLEMITPPGHIYVRYREGGEEINIETTARGIHIDSKEYLSVGTRSLQQRNIKDVIGLAHFNHASVFWQKGDYLGAIKSYRIAEQYLPDDMLLKELLGYNLIFSGQLDEGRHYLEAVKDHLPDYAVSKDQTAKDYLEGKVDAEGIQAIFSHVDETRNSILKKKERLQRALEKYPHYRSGLMAMAVTWLQLHRTKEGLGYLEKYHQQDNTDPTIEYYLAALYAERHDYEKAWVHFQNCETIVKKRKHLPHALKQLKRELIERYPEQGT